MLGAGATHYNTGTGHEVANDEDDPCSFCEITGIILAQPCQVFLDFWVERIVHSLTLIQRNVLAVPMVCCIFCALVNTSFQLGRSRRSPVFFSEPQSIFMLCSYRPRSCDDAVQEMSILNTPSRFFTYFIDHPLFWIRVSRYLVFFISSFEHVVHPVPCLCPFLMVPLNVSLAYLCNICQGCRPLFCPFDEMTPLRCGLHSIRNRSMISSHSDMEILEKNHPQS